MTEIIQRWIQDRLGVLINVSPEAFCEAAKDGYLIAAILKNYEIITEEQLQLLERTDSPQICLSNFKEHVLIWLNGMGILVDDEELFKIVNSKGTAALNLFYQLYLELCGNSNLYFITEQRLREKLHPQHRFIVQRVRESAKTPEENLREMMYDKPLREAQDIVHWQKDKMQMLVTKCKEARERYLQFVRYNQTPRQMVRRISGRFQSTDDARIQDFETESQDFTYEELVRQQHEALQAPKFTPDPEQAQILLKKFRSKQKEHSENLIFKTELQRNIFTNFWNKVNKEEEDRLNDNVVEVVVKQSLYERQMHQKISEVKLQKKVMLENKRIEAHAISKQMENDLVQKMMIQDKELDAQELSYYLEKERITLLHRKLYDYKTQNKKIMCRKICTSTVEDLVKVACEEVEYKSQMGEEPPRRLRDTWKKMFVNSIPFESYVTPTEIILKRRDERPKEVEDIIHLEIERQNSIDKKDLESYLMSEWPWLVDDIQIEDHTMDEVICALNVVGNIVHNILAVKYPLPPLPPKPDLPNVTICACVNGLDPICLPVLQEILTLRQVLVVEMQHCVDFCVHAFIQETAVEMEDPAATDRPEEKKKGKGKGKEVVEKKIKKGAKAKVITDIMDEEPLTDQKEFAEKTVQTPRYYPDEEIPLSHKAELGKTAHDVLEAGEPLTNFILAAMFVEYLKSKPDMKGWVLINFPKTYDEAAALEECLTGLPVPRLGDEGLDTCVSLMEMTELEEKSKYDDIDQLEVCRRSKLLPQPVPPKDPEFYDTALTAYIKVIKKNPDADMCDSELNPFLEDLEESDSLETFYADLGCNYHFYYNRIDFNTTKSLAKLIVGDFCLPMKSSVEIFGEAINYINEDKGYKGIESVTTVKKGEKKEKPKEKKPKLKQEGQTTKETDTDKKSKPQKPDKGGKGKKKSQEAESKVVIVHEDKYTQAPELSDESEEEVEVEATNMVKPGENGWEYVNLPIPEALQIAMATLWENSEEVYLVDMEQVFFMKRLMLNAIIPFINVVKEHMIDYMNKPDEKQKYLREFQKSYNDFEDDFRHDPDFKAEMHCRISEMCEKLVEICDWKMIAADHERVFIIEKNWTARQLIQFVNNYISALQLELDRFSDTMMLLADYYTAIITKMPSTVVIHKEILPKLELEHADITKSINDLLQTVDDAEELVLHQFIDSLMVKCYNFLDATYPSVRFATKKMKDLIEEEHKATEKLKSLHNPKDKKGAHDNKVPPPVELQFGEDILKWSSQILDEWSAGVKGETVRVKYRLELLKIDLLRNVDEVLGTIKRIFHEVYDQIQASYRKELRSINNVCHLLALAVEKELRVQEELVLDRGDFYVDPEVMLFHDKLPPVRAIEESAKTGVFTINQLDKLVDILMDLSPSGYMPERSFLYLLEDLIVNKEEPILLPELWLKMHPRDLEKISKYLFDDIEYVQWKDFIIHNLNVPFPTEKEILELRQVFREFDPDATELVTEYQFLQTKFWFEPAVEDAYRLKLMKPLLFKMYRVNADRLNYTAFLLDFCKDANPVAGLVKALTVSLGEPICWEKEVGEHFVEMERRKMLYEELRMQRRLELKGGQEVVEPLVEEFIDDVMDFCRMRDEGCFDLGEGVEEIQREVEEEEKDENGLSFGTNIKLDVEPVPELAYFMPLELLRTVIVTCLPWHARVQNIEDKSFIEMTEEVYSHCKHRDFGFKVLFHEFLNHPMFVEELSKANKFTAKNLVQTVEDILEEKGSRKSNKL